MLTHSSKIIPSSTQNNVINRAFTSLALKEHENFIIIHKKLSKDKEKQNSWNIYNIVTHFLNIFIQKIFFFFNFSFKNLFFTQFFSLGNGKFMFEKNLVVKFMNFLSNWHQLKNFQLIFHGYLIKGVSKSCDPKDLIRNLGDFVEKIREKVKKGTKREKIINMLGKGSDLINKVTGAN